MMKLVILWGTTMTLLTSSNISFAEDLFPAGAESKLAGIESGQLARGATALFYNPAQVGVEQQQSGVAVEFGYINGQVSYEHPNFDAVMIDVASPIASVGLQEKIAGDRLMFAAALFPAKGGEMQVKGIPQRIGPSVQALQVESSDLVVHGSVGLAANFESWSVGAGWVRSWENRSVYASMINNTESPLVEQVLHNNFDRIVLGVAHQGSIVRSSLSYAPEMIKKYDGVERLVGRNDTNPRTVVYEPARISAGAGLTLSPGWDFDFSLNHRSYGKGRSISTDASQFEGVDAELGNVLEWGATLATSTAINGLSLATSYASLPSPWGEGEVIDGMMTSAGPAMGNSVAVDRQSLTFGLRFKAISQQVVTASIGQTWGVREFSETGSTPGYLQIATTMASVGGVWAF
jgi:hypothetical protein